MIHTGWTLLFLNGVIFFTFLSHEHQKIIAQILSDFTPFHTSALVGNRGLNWMLKLCFSMAGCVEVIKSFNAQKEVKMKMHQFENTTNLLKSA